VLVDEVTPKLLRGLRAVLDPDYAHHAFMPLDDAFGSAIFSKVVLAHGVVVDVAGLPMQSVVAKLGGHDVRLWAVHTRAPTRENSRQLRDEMIDTLTAHRPSEPLPLIAAGDFNATIWHGSMRDLLGAGLTDAADAVGKGLRGTWKGARLMETPIDHVLVTRQVRVLDVRVGTGAGSDHRPVIADLAI